MKNFSRICAAVSVVGLLLLLTAATSVPSASMRYTFYTTNSTDVIDAHVSAIGGTRDALTNGQSSVYLPGLIATNGLIPLTFVGTNVLVKDWNFGMDLWLYTGEIDGLQGLHFDNGIIFAANFSGYGTYLTHLPASELYGTVPAGALPGGVVYGGTGAARDAFTPLSSYALWIVTDSVPPYQLSVWANGAWN